MKSHINENILKKSISKPITWWSFGLLSIAIVLVFVFPEVSAHYIGKTRTAITAYMTWYFTLLATSALIFCIWLAFSKYGKIRLGGDNAKPEYSNFAWYSMLIACGEGVGLIFWGIAEPLLLFGDSKFAEPKSAEAISSSIEWSYFHWGVHAWAIYCIVAVVLAFSIHNCNKPLNFHNAISDMFPTVWRAPVSITVEVIAIITTVLGLATSFGFAALQFNTGLNFAFGIDISVSFQMAFMVAIAGMTILSQRKGLNKGMRLISETNSWLSIVLLSVFFIFGPTIYIISLFFETVGTYLSSLFAMGLWNDSYSFIGGVGAWNESWMGNWTTFIWCWGAFSFAPFVAAFIAKVSRGRTIKEFLIGGIAGPSLIVMVWVVINGGTAIATDILVGGIVDATQANPAAGLFTTIEKFSYEWITPILSIVAIVLIATFYITSLDGGTYSLSSMLHEEKEGKASQNAGSKYRIGLSLMITVVASVLLLAGGTTVLASLQTGAMIAAVPFSVVAILGVVNLVRRLKLYESGLDTVDSEKKLEAEKSEGAPDCSLVRYD
ncbi:MAG: BCCT family transporter [Oceanisphaera sp.]|uniref:BCCT family transporter n=1 Tax=Oceanisphaera sp. TaxID=1929979 RepID=UPI003C70E3ED